VFGERIPNFQGFEYYKGGYFMLPGSINEYKSFPESEYANEFSWRNRHGKDWVTPVKHQGSCRSCWAFAPIAATELLVNIYYNSQLNYDLSEQHIISSTSGACWG
jgi:C1A family cysteine protease